MGSVRLIARLDVKGPHLIKGVHLEGVRKVGDPREFAQRYYRDGIDEIIYLDAVASLYGRNNLTDIVRRTVEEVFIPITVGGGLRSVDDVREALRSGADKVAINTAATKDPALISRVAEAFGAQCMVLSISAKRRPGGGWEALVDTGREHTGRDVVEWAVEGERLGAGEILLSSIDRDGTREGMDVELIRRICEAVSIPVIACGGVGTSDHVIQALVEGGASAVALAHVLHYRRLPLADIRSAVASAGLSVRKV